MSRFVVPLFFTLMTGCGAQLAEGPGDLTAAKSAYARFELDAATEAFSDVFENAAAPTADRAEAARRLAAIQRLVHGDTDEALAWVGRAEALGDRPFETGYERARVLLAAGEWSAAASVAGDLQPAASGALEEARAASLVLQAVWQELLATAQRGEAADEALLAGGMVIAQRELARDWGRLEMSLPAVGLALAADDGPGAFLAWSSYYHWNGADDRVHISAVAAEIEPQLRAWRGARAEASDRRALIRSLVASRMFSAATWLAFDPRVPRQLRVEREPDVAAVIAYEKFMRRVGDAAARHYRLRALGDSWSTRLGGDFDSAAAELWEVIGPDGEPYQRAAFIEESRRRFGAEIHFRGSQQQNLNYGHRVDDRTLEVEQYGRAATFQFVLFDLMVSNGFNSWFWDGGAATGGWADGGTIVQVRPAYATGPIDAWLGVTDEIERGHRAEEIARLRTADYEAAQHDPTGYFEGLRLRLRAQAHEHLLAELKSQGLIGTDLRRLFIAELQRRTFASSIAAHEGRHAIDRRAGPIATMMRSDADREFRAKLSEVAFAADPRIALVGGIVNPNIGASNAHGRANRRIMEGLVEWMRTNASSIADLDSSSPLLPQLDLLTNVQLRAAIRKMDPWG